MVSDGNEKVHSIFSDIASQYIVCDCLEESLPLCEAVGIIMDYTQSYNTMRYCYSFAEWDGEDDKSPFTPADVIRELKGRIYDYNFAEARIANHSYVL